MDAPRVPPVISEAPKTELVSTNMRLDHTAPQILCLMFVLSRIISTVVSTGMVGVSSYSSSRSMTPQGLLTIGIASQAPDGLSTTALYSPISTEGR